MFRRLKSAYGGGFRAGRSFTPKADKYLVSLGREQLNPYIGIILSLCWEIGFDEGIKN